MNALQILFQQNPMLAALCVGTLALLVGSLLNVIIYRLPILLENTWQAECCEFLNQAEPKTQKINLFFPRSFCQSCKKTIPIWRNIPLISFCLQTGRCKNCKQRISWLYPSVELLSLALSLIALWTFGMTAKLAFALPFIWGMICLFFIDLKHQLLPDSLTLGLLWLGLIANSFNTFITLSTSVYSAAGAYLVLYLFIQIFYCITGKVGMGNGDFKLFAAIGAWFGWVFLPLILFFASIAGAICGVIYLRLNHRSNDTPIPFGPFLCFFGTMILLFGNQILPWYLSVFL